MYATRRLCGILTQELTPANRALGLGQCCGPGDVERDQNPTCGLTPCYDFSRAFDDLIGMLIPRCAAPQDSPHVQIAARTAPYTLVACQLCHSQQCQGFELGDMRLEGFEKGTSRGLYGVRG